MNKLFYIILWGTLFTFGVEIIAPIYAIFVKNIGDSVLNVGAAYAIYSFVFSTLQPFMGKLADKYGRIRLAIIANLINSICLFGYIFITHIFHVFLLQILLGIGSSIASPSQHAMIADLTSKRKRGEEIGYIYMSMGYASTSAALISGIVAELISFRVVFFLGGLAALISTIPLAMLERRK